VGVDVCGGFGLAVPGRVFCFKREEGQPWWVGASIVVVWGGEAIIQP